jgi:hypothetical protein
LRLGLRWHLDGAIAVALVLLLAFVGVRCAIEPSAAGTTRPAETTSLPPEPPATGEHGFLDHTVSGDPVGWDSCQPIPYWIGRSNLPQGGEDLISWVLAEVTTISGQTFEFKGYTDTIPQDSTDYPVDGAWIGWATSTNTDAWQDHELNGSDPAVGMAATSRGDHIGSGWAMLLLDYNPKADAEAGGVLRHEIGHLIGLDHVNAQDEVMYPGGSGLTWGPGDRRGLWELGPHDCH